jgi:hypothetical protein
MSDKTTVAAPKPLTCTIECGTNYAAFHCEELLRFLRNTDDASFVVADECGNQSAILVQPVLDFLASL